MTDRNSPANEHAWRADPRRDFLGYQLLRLARAALAEHFDGDPQEKDYNTWLRRESRKKDGGKPRLLREWDEHPDRGALRLTAEPAANAFVLRAAHDDFAAAVSVTYDIDLSELDSGGLTSFRGDIAKATACARFWADELSDFGLDDLDLDEDELEEMLAKIGSPDSGDAPDEPPEDNAEDRRQVQRIAHALRDEMHGDTLPALPEYDRNWLEATPQSLWPIVDGAAAAATAKPRDDKLVEAWLSLLSQQLEQIRYRSERGHKWAIEMLDEYQEHLIDLAAKQTLEHNDLFALVAALGHAKVPVKPKLTEALLTSGPELPASVTTEHALDQAVRPLIDELARNVTSPFEVMEAMAESAAIMPPQLRSFIAHELALSPHPVMREAVPLMLLDAESEVRRSAALALDQVAAPDTLSPVSLRRAIALRNWIPEADRAALDQAIRKARTKGVQPAQWERAPELVLRASPIDGSGAQSMVFAAKAGRTGLFCGLLLKQSFGIRDAWCGHDTPRREIASAVAEMQRSVKAPEVERAYIDLAVQHGIAIGVAEGHPPDPALLDIAEAISAADWKDRRLDAAAETERLFGELPTEQRTAGAITASLRRSQAWMDDENTADSWFEDDTEVRDALAPIKQQTVAEAARMLLDGVLTQRRGVWAERFVLTALWARAVKAGQPSPLGGSARAMTWRDLVVLAHEVLSPRPLREIPLMAEVAERTVIASRAGWG